MNDIKATNVLAWQNAMMNYLSRWRCADMVEELYWEMFDNFTMDKDFTDDEKI